MTHTPERRAGDTDRSRALDKLGTFFADGYLDLAEFDERTAQAAGAKTLRELEELFVDLPDGSDAPGEYNVDRAVAPQAELDELSRKRKIVDRADTVIWSTTMVLFFLGLFVFHWIYFWVMFPVAAMFSWAVRGLTGLSDDEEELADELEKAEAKERKQRLRRAAERRRELGQ